MLIRGSASIVALAALVAPLTAGLGTSFPVFESPPSHLSTETMAQRHAAEAPFDPHLAGLSPGEAIQYAVQGRNVLGRTPIGWVDWIESTYGVGSAPAASDPPDLTTETLRLYGFLTLPVDETLLLHLSRHEAELPPGVRGPLARVVRAVADAYEAGLPGALDLLARWPAKSEFREPWLSVAERDGLAHRASSIVAAVQEFRAATDGLLASPDSVPTPFSDPEGLVILGTTGPDVYSRSGLLPDPILILDPGGNDVYLNSAGGANPTGLLPNLDPMSNGALPDGNRLVVSVVADLAGHDSYLWDGPPAVIQGAAALGAIGLLIDVEGDDKYVARVIREDVGPIFDVNAYYLDGGGQGYGYGGIGVHLDGGGNDLYQFDVASASSRSIWAFAQGFGSAGGLGVSYDAGGRDDRIVRGLGVSGGFAGLQGTVTQGAGLFGGVGVLVDGGSEGDSYSVWNNATRTEHRALGFGGFGGAGIFLDYGGDDRYHTVSNHAWGLSTTFHGACGTGVVGGTGAFIELAGDDSYFADAGSFGRTLTMAEGHGGGSTTTGGLGAGSGFFWDAHGDDAHIVQVRGAFSQASGRGALEGLPDPNDPMTSRNTFATYLDSEGSDTYVGPGGENRIWFFGADLDSQLLSGEEWDTPRTPDEATHSVAPAAVSEEPSHGGPGELDTREIANA